MKTTAPLRLVLKSASRRLFPAFAAVMVLSCLSSRGAAATGVTVIHTFSQSEFPPPSPVVNADGASPGARMTPGSGGYLYGTTTAGGVNGAGIIFNLSPAGILTDLYDFPEITNSGIAPSPNELTAGSQGFFYGTTQSGGTNGTGTIFKWGPSGGELDIYTFSAEGTSFTNTDGISPAGALVQGTNGNYYGTTQYGGSNGTGTIFQVTPNGAFTSLYSFSALGGAFFTANPDGATPDGLTLGTDGNFYGVTQGGGANGAGEFFQFTAAGVLTPLYSFGAMDSDAANPEAALVQGPNGNFYGTSATGGSGVDGIVGGTIFEMTPAGVETVLYSFSGGNDGELPSAALTLGSDGNFYGADQGGGVSGAGTLFKITPAGVFSSVYSFALLNAFSENPSGAGPTAALTLGQDGNLYGSCMAGGANGNGTIFRYTNAAFVSPIQPPLITTQPPAKLSGLAGTFGTLNTAAKGAPLLIYQWLKNKTNVLSNGGDISGSATSALIVGPFQAADAGSYSLMITNPFGSTTSTVTVLTVTPDITIPTIKITSPTASARTNAPVFSGTAADNARVTNVLWWLTNKNDGPLLSGTAVLTRGGSNWSIAVTPFPGTNILAVQSVDSSGNKSKIAAQTFFYKVTDSLGLFAGGDGTGSFSSATASVRNDTIPGSGAVLNIGEGYSIKAVAGRDSLFSNWVSASVLGVFTNTNAALSFVMQSNMVLTANFASNFFLAAHGTYNGLFYNTNAVAAESSGMISGLALGTNGTFSARLWKAGTPYAFSGGFNVAGYASNNVGPATAATGGVLKVNLAVDRAAQQITGTVSNTQWSASLAAELAGTNLPSAEYTLLFVPPANAPANTPPGDGYAQVTNHLGTVTLSGKLADGAAFTAQTVAESQNGDVPVYATPYGNTGLLVGWINLTNLEAAPPTNTLAWIKKAARTYPPYTNGFTNMLDLQGAIWTNPPVKTPALILPEGQLVISNAGLFLTFNVAVSNNNALVKLAGSPTNSFTSSSIAPKTGLFTVTFGNGNGKATTTGSGAILQNQTNGAGFFPGTTNAGLILLLPPQ